MENPKPLEQHAFLQELVGEWVVVDEEGSASPPDAPAWLETFRAVGDLWVIGEGRGTMPDGAPGATVITLGYDPAEGHFVGSWIGSMMTKLWVYKGALEQVGGDRILTLEAEGPSMDGSGGTDVYHDVITLTSDGRRKFAGSVREPDGTYRTFMTVIAHRKS